MERAAALRWAVDLLSGSLTDAESSRDPPTLSDPILQMRTHAYRAAFPDLTITVRQLVVDGDWVAVHATGRGRHTAVFQGCPPTGREWSAACTAMFQVIDHQVVHGWVTWDLLSILEQLGAIERSDTVSA